MFHFYVREVKKKISLLFPIREESRKLGFGVCFVVSPLQLKIQADFNHLRADTSFIFFGFISCIDKRLR